MKVLHRTCLLALALVARDDTPRYAPKQGARLSRTWDSRMDLDLYKLEVKIYGTIIEGSESGIQMKFQLERNLELTDTLGAMEEGRPERVERAFSKAHALTKLVVRAEKYERKLRLEGDSPLLDEAVVFKRDGDGWKLGFAEDSKRDTALLEDLEQDLDFTGLLPNKQVEVGASWEPEAKALDALLRPGGALKIKLEPSGDRIEGAEILNTSPDLLIGAFEGDVKATLLSVEEMDGARLAHIGLEIDVRAKKDLTDVARQAIEASEQSEGVRPEVHEAADELAWQAKGELVWDLKAGHVRSASLEGKVAVSFHLRQIQGGYEGDRTEVEQTMCFSGKLGASFETEEL